MNATIESIAAREILDSRGNPTVEVDVVLDDGTLGRAGGALRRLHRRPRGRRAARRRQEALRRQGRPQGRRATSTRRIARSSSACDAADQAGIDRTHDRARRHAEQGQARRQRHPRRFAGRAPTPPPTSLGMPLYRYLGGVSAHDPAGPDDEHPQRRQARRQQRRLPGVHGPAGRRGEASREALRMGAEVFHALKKVLKAKGYNTAVGDEGGFAPSSKSNEEALEVILEAIEKAGYKPGKEIAIALDPAASEFYEGRGKGTTSGKIDKRGSARLRRDGRLLGRAGSRSIRSCSHRGRPGRGRLGRLEAAHRASSASKIQIVGDDLFVTNAERLARASTSRRRQLDPDQAQPDRHADRDARRRSTWPQQRGWTAVVSHRSGETEDTTIADLVVARTPARSRPARRAAPSASPSTTGFCASRRS